MLTDEGCAYYAKVLNCMVGGILHNGVCIKGAGSQDAKSYSCYTRGSLDAAGGEMLLSAYLYKDRFAFKTIYPLLPIPSDDAQVSIRCSRGCVSI